MKIHLVVNADVFDYDMKFDDRILGAYARRDDADAKLAEVHALFAADEAAHRAREREIRRLARGWIDSTGVVGSSVPVDRVALYAAAWRSILLLSGLDPDPPEDHTSPCIISHVEHVQSVIRSDVPIPAWPSKVEWLSPDGDEDDYRIIEMELL